MDEALQACCFFTTQLQIPLDLHFRTPYYKQRSLLVLVHTSYLATKHFKEKIVKKISIAVLLSTFVAAPAFAADEGFYIGADVGRSSTNTFDLSKKTDTAFSILGGYQFMKYLAAEIQYNDFGSITGTGGASVKINGYSAAAVGFLPLNDQLSLLGKFGYASTKLGSPASTTKSDITYGIGGQYNINPAWGVRLNYDMYKVVSPTPTSQTATTSVVSAGVVYKF